MVFPVFCYLLKGWKYHWFGLLFGNLSFFGFPLLSGRFPAGLQMLHHWRTTQYIYSISIYSYEISAVCQVRLDFDAFVLRQPSTAGLCDTDTITFTTPSGSNVALPRLCGTLTDQHSNIFFFKFKFSILNFHNLQIFFSVYIETAGQTPAATFTITTSAALFNTRMWNVSDDIFYNVGKLKCIGILKQSAEPVSTLLYKL